MQLTHAMDTNTVGALLAEKMSQYASLLAAQGSIATALAFLPDNTNQVIKFILVWFSFSRWGYHATHFKPGWHQIQRFPASASLLLGLCHHAWLIYIVTIYS